jgi:DmsE family decaheme c-type cytochrome
MTQKIVASGSWLGRFVAVSVGCLLTTLVAAAENPAPPQTLAQKALARDAVCTACHNESWPKPVLSIYQTRHGNKADPRVPDCQTCHGTSDAHLKDPGGAHPDVVFAPKSKNASPADERNGVCLTCHQSGLRMHWSGSVHQQEDLACSNCHTVHVPHDPVLAMATQPEVCYACHQTQRAQTYRISTHPILAGKVTCSDCHNPHGSTGPKLLVKNSVNETCYVCHAEKRGPFLWEHSSVVDDCTNCHTPHGSNITPLLKARVPWLCQECHSGDHGAQVNSGANLPTGNATTINGTLPLANQSPRAQLNARACLNCHVLIHGSNHPAGAKFQR